MKRQEKTRMDHIYAKRPRKVTRNNDEMMNAAAVQQQQQIHMAGPSRGQSLYQQMHQDPSNVANIQNEENIEHYPASLEPTYDLEKCKYIKNQMMFLMRAYLCKDKPLNSNKYIQHYILFKEEYDKYQSILTHLEHCHAGRNCIFVYCTVFKQILSHWKYCTQDDCPSCIFVNGELSIFISKKVIDASLIEKLKTMPKLLPTSLSQCIEYAYEVIDVQQITVIIPFQFSFLNHTLNIAGIAGNQMKRPIKSMFTAPATAAKIQQRVDEIKQILFNFNLSKKPSMVNGENIEGNLCALFFSPPEEQTIKVWDQDISIRSDHFVRLILDMAPSPDPIAIKEKKVYKLLECVRKMENDVYQVVNSQLEYCNVLIEIIRNIQEELDKRRQNWKKLQLQAQPQQQSANISDYKSKSSKSVKKAIPAVSSSNMDNFKEIRCDVLRCYICDFLRQHFQQQLTVSSTAAEVAANSSSTDITRSIPNPGE